MRKLISVFLFLFISLNTIAQKAEIYEQLKKEGINKLHAGYITSAKRLFDLMYPYVDSSNKKEYDTLLNLLKDSITNINNKAQMFVDKKQYQLAIIEFQRLIGRDKNPLVKPLYAYIGYCYEMLSTKELAKSYYELGIQHKEQLSALRMAIYIRYNRIPTTSDFIINLYKQSLSYYASRDSLGIEYARLGKINDSYTWFKKSQSNFSKYKRATYILDNSTYLQLSNKHRNDDPIRLLTEASNEGYSPAQYYLGLLYYYAKEEEIVEKNPEKGLELMKKAASKYEPAKKMLKRIISSY